MTIGKSFIIQTDEEDPTVERAQLVDATLSDLAASFGVARARRVHGTSSSLWSLGLAAAMLAREARPKYRSMFRENHYGFEWHFPVHIPQHYFSCADVLAEATTTVPACTFSTFMFGYVLGEAGHASPTPALRALASRVKHCTSVLSDDEWASFTLLGEKGLRNLAGVGPRAEEVIIRGVRQFVYARRRVEERFVRARALHVATRNFVWQPCVEMQIADTWNPF